MWAASDTYRVRDGHVRIRSSSPEVGAAVRATLADRLVDDDGDGSYAYSLRLAPRTTDPQALHVLYEDCKVVVRSRDPLRVLRVLVAHVEGRDALGRRGPLQLAGCAVVGSRGAAVLPVELEADLARIERRLNAAGLQNVDAPFLTFDPITAELEVAELPEVDASLLDGIDLYRGAEAGGAPPGRHRVRGWLLDGLRGVDDVRRPAMTLALNADALTPERVYRLIGRIQDGSTLAARWYPWPDDLAAAIVRLAEGRR